MRYSVFYQLPSSSGQDLRARYRDTMDQIVHAEALGFHTAWLAEGHFDASFSVMPSPLTVAAALSARTRSIRLGTAAIQLSMHHPVEIAEMAATVDVLSGGRLELGVGRGSSASQLAGYGVPWQDRDSRFREALDILERAFTQPRLSYRGKHFQPNNLAVQPRPVTPSGPPIHVTANSEQSARFTGERGLGLLVAAPIHPWPHELSRQIAIYRDAATRAGTRPRVGAVFFVFPGRDRAEVRAVVAPSLRNHPIGAAVPFDLATEAMAVFGSPDECAEKLASIAATGLIDELLCWFNPGGLIRHERVLAAMTTFREEVLDSLDAGPITVSSVAR